MSKLKDALEAAGHTVTKYDPKKTRAVHTNKGNVTVPKFTEQLVEALGDDLHLHPEIVKCINSVTHMSSLLEELSEVEGWASSGSSQHSIPPEIAHLTLNIDRASKEVGVKRYFCTTPDEIIDTTVSGQYYIEACDLAGTNAVKAARAVVPKYLPRSPKGVQTVTHPTTGVKYDRFNTYIPAEWELWKRRNPAEWARLPDKPPEEIMRFLKHLIPDKTDREYFYAWTYTSITSRSFVYLVLQGLPGVGKNRLKVLLGALHGKENTVDGKKETFGASDSKFNSQMVNNTMVWFDELKYGPDMEPRMKEYQNPNISIERKGIDATSSTEIFSSMVISNNYPRDNYILFNSRKFAPVGLGNGPLTNSMDPEEIAEMSERLSPDSKSFDVKYVAQIAKWILRIGGKHAARWPNLEYQGPKFWELAHTSMSRWQKIAVMALTTKTRLGMFPGWDPDKKAFLWSKVEEALRRKKEYESKDYRDAVTVKSFFQTYCDEKGVKIFTVEEVPNSVVQDFWIRPAEIKEGVGPITLGGTSAKEPPKKIASPTPAPKTNALPSKETLARPKGMNEFQWRKFKKEWEAENGKG